jgi:hypothetical protein
MANFNTMLVPPQVALPGRAAWLRTDAKQWQAGTLDRDGLHAAAVELATRPAHVEAARSLATHLLAFLDDVPVAKRVVHDTPIYLLLVFCMVLHARRDPAKPASGITLKALRTLFASRGAGRSFAGDSHIRDMLAWARLRGLLQYVQAAAGASVDRRVRPLEPTALLVGLFQHWARAFLRGCAPALVPALPPEPLPPPPVVYEVLCYRIDAYLHDRFVLTERFPLIQGFMLHKHGYHVFLSLMAALRPGQGEASAAISVSGLAQRFQVARGTIRNTLDLAQESGHLVLDGDEGVVRITPAFLHLSLRWMAMEATWMHGLTQAAVSQQLAMRA